MSFINNYSSYISYTYSKEFVEGKKTFILSLGISKSGFNGIVSKVDLDGNVIWEKYYLTHFSAGHSNPLTFNKIIQINPRSSKSKALGTQYIISVVGSEDKTRNFLLSIDSVSGNANWFKQFENKENNEYDFFIEPRREEGSSEDYSFYVAFSNKNYIKEKSSPYIGKYDFYGNFVSGNNLSFKQPKIKINDIYAHSKGLGIACEYINKNNIHLGIIIDYPGIINVSELTGYLTGAPMIIHSIKSKAASTFYFSGHYIKTGRVFVAKFSPRNDVYPLLTPLRTLPNTTNHESVIQLANNNGLYLLNKNDQTSVIHSLDENLDINWSKELRFDEFGNTIDGMTFNDFTNNITAHISNDLINNALVLTDESLNTCKTVDLSKKFDNIDNNIELSSIDLKSKSFNLVDTTITITVIDTTIKTEYCPPFNGEINITEITSLQSPNFYLQATGSIGNDSTKGIHSRWLFRGALGEKHLPKGNNASNNVNFNKPDDFVKIYRAKYVPKYFRLDISTTPTIVDDTNRLWIYNIDEKEFFVYFRDTVKYDELRNTINPSTNTQEFINQYKNRLIEIENKTELFFGVFFEPLINVSSISNLQLEALSVAENTLVSPKILSFRNLYNSESLSNVKLRCENGRSIRFIPNNCTAYKINFEFYSDYIVAMNSRNEWNFIGEHALSLDDSTVLTALEPTANTVHGKWKRFNGNDTYVNINNYIDKWNGTVEEEDRNIKEIVGNYITLSNNESNPTAIESIELDDFEGETLEVSNLNLLNIGSYDFHVARMLGLGILDLDNIIFNGSHVYIAEYATYGDLEDGLGAREVQHLSMSLPTSLNDDRLPLPADLKEIIPGMYLPNQGGISNMTDEEGYTPDGRLRFISLFSEIIPENQIYPPFFNQSEKFIAHTFTYPVYAGLEYRKVLEGDSDSGNWEVPEISNDFNYVNVDQNGNEVAHSLETRFIAIPELDQAFFRHKHRVSGDHIYKSYGINWFSRAAESDIELVINTRFDFNPLLPPTNINSVLIREESPLLLSSADEQDRHRELRTASPPIDKTLIRLTFDYYSFQDLVNYKIPFDSIITNNQLLDPANANEPNILFPDNQEVFADNIDIYFRNETPNNISGKIISVEQDLVENILSIITTENYYIASAEPVSEDPYIPPLPNASPIVIAGTETNYIGGTLIIGQQQYIIHELHAEGADNLAVFKVYNKEISDGIILNTIPSVNAQDLQIPEITGDGFFMAVENMQNAESWGNPNPLVFNVEIDPNWTVHREILGIPDDEGNIERQVEKSRGIWSDATLGTTIEEIPEPVEQTDGSVVNQHNGLYKFTFNGLQLAKHPQNLTQGNDQEPIYIQEHMVQWHKGIIRVYTQNSITGDLPSKRRKNLNVHRIENVGSATEDLVVYAFDPSFSVDLDYDSIQTGNAISVNYYPGYKVYLYKDQTYGLTETNILPEVEGEEDVKYSIFGFQSKKNYELDTEEDDKKSKISIPSLMFAQKMIEALPPEQPEGVLYATRPDFFGRSTYTLTTKYQHKPHGVLFYRSNDEALLNALYSKNTVLEIRENLKHFGGSDEQYFNNRWENFLNFEELINDGDFKEYPPQGVGEEHYKFPNPDKLAFFEWANVLITRINENTAFPPENQISLFNVDVDHVDYANIPVGDPSIINFVKGAIFSAFVPLTEVPIIYQHIKGNEYNPINKKQVIKDRNGRILNPNHEDFEMAPMMKVTSNVVPHETQFVDFNLDGTSNNIYFYGVRELSSQMKMGEFSPFLGPIKLVNTNPPESPEIKRIMPVLENPILAIAPSIQLEINAYPEVQNIKKINIYRAFNKLDSLSIRTMKLVKTIDIEDVGIVSEAIWSVQDDFSDLDEIPYNDGLFYRITVAKKVEYAKANYTPDVDGTTEIITDYAPSQASKIVATMMVEIANPISPILNFTSAILNDDDVELTNVILNWEKMSYKGIYHVYKMNTQGNWVKKHQLQTNENIISLPLLATDLASDSLQIRNEDGKPIYHHFKVITENTSGMLSTEEHILTILQNLSDLDYGIGNMTIGSTFNVK